MYVKGCDVDRAKIMLFLNSANSEDGRIDSLGVVFKILDYVDRREHPICGAHTMNDSINMNVIAVWNEASGDDLDELRKKELSPPYLEKGTGLLRVMRCSSSLRGRCKVDVVTSLAVQASICMYRIISYLIP